MNSKYNFYQAFYQYKKCKRERKDPYKLFNLPENPYNKECHIPDILYYNKEIIPNSLVEFLTPHDFIFIKKHQSAQPHS